MEKVRFRWKEYNVKLDIFLARVRIHVFYPRISRSASFSL